MTLIICHGGKVMEDLQSGNYKGNEQEMGKGNKDKAQDTVDISKLEVSIASVQASLHTAAWIGGTLILILTSVLGWMATQLYDINGTIKENTIAIANLDTRLCNLETRMGNLETKMDSLSTRISSLETRVSLLETKVFGTEVIVTDDSFSQTAAASFEANNISASLSSFTAETKVGTDSNGNVCLAADLVNETVLLVYNEDGREVYFLGQYNENYHWDGYCVTNVYNADGSLYGICESNFSDGERLDFRSFYSMGENNKWRYSDKVCHDDGSNTGIGIQYKYDCDIKKDLTLENVTGIDMLHTSSLLESIEPTMLTYCSGTWKDGELVDDTGVAYEAIFDEDGTVKTLYVGQFKDSTFNDATGNAWEIVYAGDAIGYVLNTGIFSDGSAEVKSKEPIDQQTIEEIVSRYHFGCNLKWKE